MLQFAGFQFDPIQKILYQNNEIITLTANQAKLLALFLADPQQIFSKEYILEEVWSGRVVSEQVVFQNISQLRAIFSDSAIKTFPKRGYQWQITILDPPPQAAAIEDDITDVVVNNEPTINLKAKNNKVFAAIALTLLVIIVGYFSYPQKQYSSEQIAQHENKTAAKVILLPFSTRFEGSLSEQIAKLNKTLVAQFHSVENEAKETSKKEDVWSFINSPFMVHKQLIDTDEQLVLSGLISKKSYSNDDNAAPQYFLEYLLQGQYRKWQGYLLADSVSELSKQLLEQVNFISQSQYFTLVVDAFTTAELSLMHSQQPSNLDILKHLIERLLFEDNLDVASAHIEQMLSLSTKQQHPTYIAYGTWLKGKLLIEHGQYAMSQSTLEEAIRLMAAADMLSLQSEVNKSLSDIAAYHKDFKKVQEYLYQSASQARLAKRPIQEIRAYTLLSIKASKLKLNQQRYDYLYQAQTLLDDYQLDGSHYMLIFYHFALFAQTDEEREKYYLKILEQPTSQNNLWVFYSAVEQLSSLYLKQEKWQQALNIANSFSEVARSSALKAELYKAQQQLDKALEYAKIAFNSARTQHIDWLSRDMALMLLELTIEDSDTADSLLYKSHLKKVKPGWWSDRHKERLAEIGILVDPYNEQANKI